ncbi:oxygen-independent coproporphyrinogen III oxidase [Mesohalobacter halotolerans]|uniref:Coproporphyrinogen-III oxidase n=1 Tax=Mesohalobacter halotolerans TaxID=1883405 RepID=A0A4U5TRG9_9FLAO|nr:oxygen-independent coproporphyrinogen III oxidase [Mesohalobacter halotolerans]MBS3737994.1 oxygen-independent coproporphyrinogen III oxidase [Psychroflexus sp.]TKS56696.1 oxygen-independent coproporphyrinogen III oxidase [Mesohalobacter halotolerans]
MQNLITKYNVAGPRYTSYPTVPYWGDESFSYNRWLSTVRDSAILQKPISLYIHLPFCESLCTFCACNKRITKRHLVEQPYIKALLKELDLYTNIYGFKLTVKDIHLGGGTPTFFSPENLAKLLQGILERTFIAEDAAFSFEGHPNNTTYEHLKVLNDYHFNRVSYGIQDYNETVQKAINRIQSFDNVKYVTDTARKVGYTSVGHDLIYGLPFQTVDHILNTIDKTIELRPDRIAFYSYAHTPWIKGNGQRGFKDSDLPNAETKRLQYELGKKMLEDNGYQEIGMDHFALAQDELSIARQNKTLHRNFMGYTTQQTHHLIGLGVSSISDAWFGFAQNEKQLEDYYERLKENKIPVFRGHILTTKDLEIRQHILNLMTKFETDLSETNLNVKTLQQIHHNLQTFINDDLIEINNQKIKVYDKSKAFIRNICMAFDLRLLRKQPDTRLFSMTI